MDVGSVIIGIASAAAGILIGGRIAEVTRDRDRAIKDRRIALALLADLDRLRRELPQPGLGFRGDVTAIHPRLQGAVVSMVEFDPESHFSYVKLEQAVAQYIVDLTAFDYRRSDVERHQEWIEQGELERQAGVKESNMPQRQAQISRDAMPGMIRDLDERRLQFERAEAILRSSLSDLELRLRKAVESRIPSLSPWDDKNGPSI